MTSNDRPEEDGETGPAALLVPIRDHPGPDGRLDIEQIMGRMQGLMSAFTSQMASFGKSDPDSGMNWSFTKDVVEG